MEGNTQSNMIVLSKITVKDMLGAKPSVRDIPQGGRLHVMSVIGVVNGAVAWKTKESDKKKRSAEDDAPSEGFSLSGQFQAKSAKGVAMSGVCIIPGALGTLYTSQARALAPGQSFDLACDVYVLDDATSNVGYKYEVTSRLSMTAPTALQSLAKLVNFDTPLLPQG